MNNKTIAVAVAGAAGLVLSMTSVAFAQDATAQGGVSAQASVGAPPLPPAQAAPPPAPAPVYAAAPVVVHDDEPDHERFVGHFAVGYFGISQLPIATGLSNAGAAAGNVNAPVIGVRYWLQRNLGLDIGLGIGYQGGSVEGVAGGNTVSVDKPSLFGMAVHGGVPLAFAHGRHYSFLVIPEATVGFTSGSLAAQGNAPQVDLSGFKLDVGGRIGAEIHFGFIGIPELSLEGSVGVFVSREAIKAKQDQVSASDGTTKFGTSVQSDPWALFVNNISAFYYF